MYFSRQILFSGTFQGSPVYSSTFQACVNPGITVKPVLRGHSKEDPKNSRIMQLKSIAECSHGAFCSTFDLHLGMTLHGLKTFVSSIFNGCL